MRAILRPYQQSAREAIERNWDERHHYTLLVLPTGTSKTGIALSKPRKRRDERPSTPQQIRQLESHGFQHVRTWSVQDASTMIMHIAAQGWHGVPKGVDPRTYVPGGDAA